MCSTLTVVQDISEWALVRSDSRLPTIPISSCDQASHDPSYWAWHAEPNWMSIGLLRHQWDITLILLILSESPPLLFAFGPCLSFPSQAGLIQNYYCCTEAEIHKSLEEEIRVPDSGNSVIHASTPLVQTNIPFFKQMYCTEKIAQL